MDPLKLDISDVNNRAVIGYNRERDCLVVSLERWIDYEWVSMIDVLSDHRQVDVSCRRGVE